MKEPISCIICAYNEGNNINAVLKPLMDISFLTEIIVVDDGSTDNTANAVRKYKGVRLVTYKPNKGKGFALYTGIKKSKHDCILLLDADLRYLNEGHVNSLVDPILYGNADLTIGITTKGATPVKKINNIGQNLGAFATGMRAFRKKTLTCMDVIKNTRYQVDIAITNDYIRRNKVVKIIRLPGLDVVTKFEKTDTFNALIQFAKMGTQMIDAFRVYPPIPGPKELVKAVKNKANNLSQKIKHE